MRKSVFFILLAALTALNSAQALNRAPEDEMVDPTCAPSPTAPVNRHTTFVNGTRLFNWEIRTLTKGNHFNYEICFDRRSNTNVNKLPQEFAAAEGEKNPCVLASDVWIHNEALPEFKTALKAALKEKIAALETRETRTEMFKWIDRAMKTGTSVADNVVEVSLPLVWLGLRVSGRLSLMEGSTMSIRAGSKAVKALKALAFFSILDLAYKAYTREGWVEPVVKDKNGAIVTETTEAAKEIKEVVKDIEDKLELSDEQGAIVIDFIFEQLRDSIPKAMHKTAKSIGCIQES